MASLNLENWSADMALVGIIDIGGGLVTAVCCEADNIQKANQLHTLLLKHVMDAFHSMIAVKQI